jgi:hypothetical protein
VQNDLNLVFVAVSLPIGPLLMYLDDLLKNARDKFVRSASRAPPHALSHADRHHLASPPPCH